MTSLIWAIILIIVGIEIVIKIFFKASFPLFKLVIAAFCIYTGINMLYQKNPDGTENKLTLKEQAQKTYKDGCKLAKVMYKKAYKASNQLIDEAATQKF